jgi:hypothetical protein
MRVIRNAALALLALGALVVCDLEAMTFVSVGLMGFCLLATMLTSLILLTVGVVKRRSSPVCWAVGLVAVLATSKLLSGTISREQWLESQRRGDVICSALAQHHERTGRYPDNLSALVPEDLTRIPATAMGVVRTFEFHYGPEGADGYSLGFPLPGWYSWRRGPTDPWRLFD